MSRFLRAIVYGAQMALRTRGEGWRLAAWAGRHHFRMARKYSNWIELGP